jgi:hypothetical protein
VGTRGQKICQEKPKLDDYNKLCSGSFGYTEMILIHKLAFQFVIAFDDAHILAKFFHRFF